MMNRILYLFTIFMMISVFKSFKTEARENVFQLYGNKNYEPVRFDRIESMRFDLDSGKIIIMVDSNYYDLPLPDLDSVFMQPAIPLIEINTDEPLKEIPNREDYKASDFIIQGFGTFDDVETRVDIRGRGNSSWSYGKKPYRLKFDKKISLCGLTKAKSYVLLANYNDPCMMEFAVATEMAKWIEMPYTNTVIPVDLKLNGIYKGSYVLTNKPGINAGSVDIDEDNSIMWELDSYFDEAYKFRSPIYYLPVMVDDPEVDDELFAEWKEDFIEMENGIYKGKAGDYINLDLFARFLLINDIMKNDELQHPKSVKLFKTKGGKYQFGPIWDFDGAMSYWVDVPEFYSLKHIDYRVTRHKFFQVLEKDPEVRQAYRKYWKLLNERLPELLEFIDSYAAEIRLSALRNSDLWPDFGDFDHYLEKMKIWFQKRFEAMEEFDIIKEGNQAEDEDTVEEIGEEVEE